MCYSIYYSIRAQPQVTCVSKVYRPNRHTLVRRPTHTNEIQLLFFLFWIGAKMITSRIVWLNNAIPWYIFNILKSASSLANLMGAAPQRPLLTSCHRLVIRCRPPWIFQIISISAGKTLCHQSVLKCHQLVVLKRAPDIFPAGLKTL